MATGLGPGSEPVDAGELIYRRIPVSMDWYSPSAGLSPEAFDPRKDETTGISVSRDKYQTVEQAAAGPSKKGYWVAIFRAADLQRNGIRVEPRPTAENP